MNEQRLDLPVPLSASTRYEPGREKVTSSRIHTSEQLTGGSFSLPLNTRGNTRCSVIV